MRAQKVKMMVMVDGDKRSLKGHQPFLKIFDSSVEQKGLIL
jgi:hypothetical protein